MEEIIKSKVYQESLDLLSVNRVKYNEKQSFVLLDGILDSSHNLMQHTMIGLALNECYGYNLAFLCLNKPSAIVKDFSKAIGAEIFSLHDFRPKKFSISWFKQRWELYKVGRLKPDKVIDFYVEGILVGDLLYDSIIRFSKTVFTSTQFTKADIKKHGTNLVINCYSMQELIKSNNVDYLSLSHKFYNSFGTISRVVTKKNITFISKKRAHLNRIVKLKEHYINDFYIDKKLLNEIQEIPLIAADSYVRARFEGTLVYQHDVKFAYNGKKDHSEIELAELLNLDLTKPIGAIMPHAFSDVPHCDEKMIFKDYYHWLIETIKIVSEIDNIQWVIKSHPSSSLFYEEGVVSELIKNSKNIHLVPNEVKPNSLLKLSDAAITVRGTVGIECILFDNQSILAGDSYYKDCGFTVNCTSIPEYKKALNSIKKKKRLDDSQKDLVRKILFWRNESTFFNKGLVLKERVSNLSSDMVIEHELSNYKKLADELKTGDLKSDGYFKILLEYFSMGKVNLNANDTISIK